MYSKEIKGFWYGVKIPTWLRAIDCRTDPKDPLPKTTWGTTLFASERAEVDLGLRGDGFWHATTPVSCQTYCDSRTASESELHTQVERMLEEAIRMKKEYDNAGKNPAKEGDCGGVCYFPLAIVMSNYGWSVLCDRRVHRVRAFKS